jgi:hypothetical protein
MIFFTDCQRIRPWKCPTLVLASPPSGECLACCNLPLAACLHVSMRKSRPSLRCLADLNHQPTSFPVLDNPPRPAGCFGRGVKRQFCGLHPQLQGVRIYSHLLQWMVQVRNLKVLRSPIHRLKIKHWQHLECNSKHLHPGRPAAEPANSA